MAVHPGPRGEYSVVRWTAPAADSYAVEAAFQGLANATTDAHILHNGRPLFEARLNLQGHPNAARHAAQLKLARGDTLDFVVGWGNGSYGSDSTALNATIKAGAGKTFDVAADFSGAKNPGPGRGLTVSSRRLQNQTSGASHSYSESRIKSGPPR